MTINEWWSGDPDQRFWMEITDRADLGSDLHAPQVDDVGRDYWSYSLVTAVRPGDVVLHWHKSLLGSPGIVAYSTAVTGPVADEIVWNSQGARSRSQTTADPEPAWRYVLSDFTPFGAPIGQDVFRAVEPALREVKRSLEAQHRGALYFPFAFSDRRPVRAAQGYLVKFPVEIVRAVPMLARLAPGTPERSSVPRPSSSEAATSARRRANGGSGYLADVRVRLAIERHAVEWAMRYYAAQGYEVEDVGAVCSYDVRAVSAGSELHIEVKGSSGTAETVELTANEIDHARSKDTHLVVVDQISWHRRADGTVGTTGGRVRRWAPWVPDESSLLATRFRHVVGDGHTDESML
jgi:hypothetical protein